MSLMDALTKQETKAIFNFVHWAFVQQEQPKPWGPEERALWQDKTNELLTILRPQASERWKQTNATLQRDWENYNKVELEAQGGGGEGITIQDEAASVLQVNNGVEEDTGS